MDNFQASIEFDNIYDVFQTLKINRKNLSIEQLYRESVDKWNKCLNSNKNNRYAERLEKATNKMNELREKLIQFKQIKI